MKTITCPCCMRQFEMEAENISGRFRCPDCHIRFAVDADGTTTEINDSEEVFLLFPRNLQLSIWERLFFAAAWIIWTYVLFASMNYRDFYDSYREIDPKGEYFFATFSILLPLLNLPGIIYLLRSVVATVLSSKLKVVTCCMILIMFFMPITNIFMGLFFILDGFTPAKKYIILFGKKNYWILPLSLICLTIPVTLLFQPHPRLLTLEITNYFCGKAHYALPNNLTHIPILCGNPTTIHIPQNIVRINERAFEQNRNLTVLNLPESIRQIGDSAFAYCDSLTTINIPSQMTDIGKAVFYGCHSLKVMTIPGNVKTIGKEAFSFSGLVEVTFSSGVTVIGPSAFYGCNDLKNITIPSSIKNIDSLAFARSGLMEVKLNPGVAVIGSEAFFSTALKEVNIPDSVIEIGDRAFAGCKNLQKVILPRRFAKNKENIFETNVYRGIKFFYTD